MSTIGGLGLLNYNKNLRLSIEFDNRYTEFLEQLIED